MRASTPKQPPADGAAEKPVRASAALVDLARHPAQTFLYSWNWKAALLSVVLRAPIFLVATWHHGLEAISIAVVAEAAYSAAISGCYGAFVEKLRNARPLWVSGLLILLVLPAILFWFDYLLHWYTGMPNLRGGMVSAAVLSMLSSLFNWYLMSHGSLLVGSQRRSFGYDLKRMPRMVLGFVVWGPRQCYRILRGSHLHLQV
jgi:hypothetical protein